MATGGTDVKVVFVSPYGEYYIVVGIKCPECIRLPC